jgi:hypothetical protein
VTRLKPWAGWVGGLFGWLISDLIGTSLAQANCAKAELPVMVAIGATGAGIAIVGGLVSWSAWRSAGELDQPGAGTRRFLAGTGILAAGIFLFAIIFQTMSSFIIPQCHV